MNGLNSKSPILQITVECGDGYYRKCLTHSNEYLIQNPICPGLKDEVQDVLDTFDKMVYCYAKGIKDPKMAEIYAGIESFCRNLVHLPSPLFLQFVLNLKPYCYHKQP